MISYGQILIADSISDQPATADPGQIIFLKDTGTLQVYTGSAWVSILGAHGHAAADISNLTSHDHTEKADSTHSHSDYVTTNDARLTDARTPLSHSHDYANTTHNHDAAYSGTGHTHNYAGTSHSHAQADVTNLTTDLAGKASTSHTHTKSQVTDFAHSHPASELTATGTRDATTFLRGDNTWAAPAGGSSAQTKVVLTAEVINNNAIANTLQDITGLSFSVTSGTRYGFQFLIPYTAAATTTGSRWTINGPATSFLSYTSRYTLTATTETVNYLSAYSQPAASNASSLAAGNIAVIEGFLTPSANGTVIARFASEVLSSAITAKAGATLFWWTA